MNIRNKRLVLVYFAMPVGCTFLSLLGFIHWSLLILLFGYFFFLGNYIKKMKCPNCSVPLGNQKKKYWKKRVDVYSIWTKKKCDHCGHKF